MHTRKNIEDIAADLGFNAVKFAPFGPTPHMEAYDRWLSEQYHGDMAYLERGRQVRAEPGERLENIQSVLVLGMYHHHRAPPDPGGLTGRVARYAWGRDYHNLIGKRVRKMRKALRELGVQNWGGVDTPPVLERMWANAAGLGFSGKNTLQIYPAHTSWMFLAVLFLDTAIEPDTPLPDHCGRCTRCLVQCPTQAFVGPRQLDATRCISYWTIESPGIAPRELRASFGRWVFGCDVCQEVCPHNVTPPDATEPDFLPKHAFLDLTEILSTEDSVLMEKYIGTPLRRPKGPGLKRNALIALGNIGDVTAIDSIIQFGLSHESPVVQAAGIWALARLGHPPPKPKSTDHALVSDEINSVRNGEVEVMNEQP